MASHVKRGLSSVRVDFVYRLTTAFRYRYVRYLGIDKIQSNKVALHCDLDNHILGMHVRIHVRICVQENADSLYQCIKR